VREPGRRWPAPAPPRCGAGRESRASAREPAPDVPSEVALAGDDHRGRRARGAQAGRRLGRPPSLQHPVMLGDAFGARDASRARGARDAAAPAVVWIDLDEHAIPTATNTSDRTEARGVPVAGKSQTAVVAGRIARLTVVPAASRAWTSPWHRASDWQRRTRKSRRIGFHRRRRDTTGDRSQDHSQHVAARGACRQTTGKVIDPVVVRHPRLPIAAAGTRMTKTGQVRTGLSRFRHSLHLAHGDPTSSRQVSQHLSTINYTYAQDKVNCTYMGSPWPALADEPVAAFESTR
jgi:hypothetical protein